MTKTTTKTMTKTKTRTDLLGVGSVGSEAPGLFHLLLAHWVPAVVVPVMMLTLPKKFKPPAVVVPPHDLRVVQRLDDDLILPRLAEGTGPGKGGYD